MKAERKAEKTAERQRREAQEFAERERRETEKARREAEAWKLALEAESVASQAISRDPKETKDAGLRQNLSVRGVVALIVAAGIVLGLLGVCEFYPSRATSSRPVGGGQRPDASKPRLKYSVLKRWKPDRDPNGLGLELVLEEEASESQLISFVRSLSAGKHPVFIGIYIDREAHYDDSKIAHGLVLVYMKRGSCNEIRWMQEIGRYSHRFGKKTKF